MGLRRSVRLREGAAGQETSRQQGRILRWPSLSSSRVRCRSPDRQPQSALAQAATRLGAPTQERRSERGRGRSGDQPL